MAADVSQRCDYVGYHHNLAVAADISEARLSGAQENKSWLQERRKQTSSMPRSIPRVNSENAKVKTEAIKFLLVENFIFVPFVRVSEFKPISMCRDCFWFFFQFFCLGGGG